MYYITLDMYNEEIHDSIDKFNIEQIMKSLESDSSAAVTGTFIYNIPPDEYLDVKRVPKANDITRSRAYMYCSKARRDEMHKLLERTYLNVKHFCHLIDMA